MTRVSQDVSPPPSEDDLDFWWPETCGFRSDGSVDVPMYDDEEADDA